MCLVHSNLAKMLEKILPDHQAEEWGGPLQVTSLELGRRCRDASPAGMQGLQGCFPSRSYLWTWCLCGEHPRFPALGALRTQPRPDPHGNPSLKASASSGRIPPGLQRGE